MNAKEYDKKVNKLLAKLEKSAVDAELKDNSGVRTIASWVTYAQVLHLVKKIEELADQYYNSED